MSMIRRERRQAFPEPPIPPFPGANIYGRNAQPTAVQALQSSAVWACVSLISSTVAMMPLTAYTLNNGVRVPIDTPQLLKQPAAGVTLHDWVYMVMVSLLLRGNAYGMIVSRDQAGYPTQIELLNPDDVTPRRDPDTGRLAYYLRGATTPINQANLWHMRGYRMPGLDVGLSPIQQAALVINREFAIQQFSLGYFQDAPNPASVLTSDQSINAEQARTIKERLMAAVAPGKREPLVLGAGLKYAPLSVSPNESQFLETQKYGAAEICRLFKMPPQKVAAADVGSSMTYTTVEMSSIDLLTFTIQDWLTNFESSLAPCFPGQKHCRFDTSVLLRTDLETRMKATAIGIASHQLTPDEARQMSDLPPLTEAQKEELALVMMTVSPSGMPKALPGAPPAGDPDAQDPAANPAQANSRDGLLELVVTQKKTSSGASA